MVAQLGGGIDSGIDIYPELLVLGRRSAVRWVAIWVLFAASRMGMGACKEARRQGLFVCDLVYYPAALG